MLEEWYSEFHAIKTTHSSNITLFFVFLYTNYIQNRIILVNFKSIFLMLFAFKLFENIVADTQHNDTRLSAALQLCNVRFKTIQGLLKWN